MSVCMRTEQSFKEMCKALLWWGLWYSCHAQGPIHYNSLRGEWMKERRPLAMFARAHRGPCRVKHKVSHKATPAGWVSTPRGLLPTWFCYRKWSHHCTESHNAFDKVCADVLCTWRCFNNPRSSAVIKTSFIQNTEFPFFPNALKLL